jgi:tetratricopeptide (TPR) repeat protein
MIYYSQGLLETALDYLQRALALREQVGNPAAIAGSLINIGFINLRQDKLDAALNYYQRALAHRELVGNPTDIARFCHNIALLHLEQEQWQNAILLFLRALSLYERMGCGFESEVADEMEELAYCCTQLGEGEGAAAYTMRAKQIREQLQKDKTA